MLISWYFLILQLGHGLAKEGTAAKSLLSLSYAIKRLCSACAQAELMWELIFLTSLPTPSPSAHKRQAASSSAAEVAALPSPSTPRWEEDGWRTGGCSRRLQQTSLAPRLHGLLGSAGREGGRWPCTQQCWSLPGSSRYFISWWSWHLHQKYSIRSGPSLGISLRAVTLLLGKQIKTCSSCSRGNKK